MSDISDRVDAALGAYEALCAHNGTKRSVIVGHMDGFFRDLIRINHLVQGSAQFITDTKLLVSFITEDDDMTICAREYDFPYLQTTTTADPDALSDYDRAMRGI